MPQTAKLFTNGRSQAVRLPKEFRFEGKEVDIRRDPSTGDVILSQKTKTWASFFALRDALIAEAPEEFENFDLHRDTRPHDRDPFA